MALTDCPEPSGGVPTCPVENSPWQIRAKRAGLSQKELAGLLGVAENTVSQQLRGKWESGIPQYVQAAIVAWEIMSHQQRNDFREQMRPIAEENRTLLEAVKAAKPKKKRVRKSAKPASDPE